MPDYPLDARCPCCQAPLLASVTVIDAGGRRGEDLDIGLELAPAPTAPEWCVVCHEPESHRAFHLPNPIGTHEWRGAPAAQASAEAAPQADAEACALCESGFADAQERQECAERRAQERMTAERGYR